MRNNMRQRILLAAACSILLIINSCKDDPVSWEDNLEPGRRDYVWTIDTLENIAPNNSYYYVWGNNPKNVWCMGSTGDLDKNILHYNGSVWSIYPDAPVGPAISPWSVFGYYADDFWVGDDAGIMWRFKDGKFKKFGEYRLEGYSIICFMSFWANAPDDIYVCGSALRESNNKFYAIIMHYDGTKWDYVVKPEIEVQFDDIKRGTKDSPNYYLTSYKADTDSAGIYEYDGKNLKLLYGNRDFLEVSPSIFSTNGRIYFYFKKKLQKYINGQFTVYKDFSSTNAYGTQIFGRSEKDFFIQTTDGIGHYNGTDLQTVFRINESIGVSDAIIFNDEVFFVGVYRKSWTFFVLHGKLKS